MPSKLNARELAHFVPAYVSDNKTQREKPKTLFIAEKFINNAQCDFSKLAKTKHLSAKLMLKNLLAKTTKNNRVI